MKVDNKLGDGQTEVPMSILSSAISAIYGRRLRCTLVIWPSAPSHPPPAHPLYTQHHLPEVSV